MRCRTALSLYRNSHWHLCHFKQQMTFFGLKLNNLWRADITVWINDRWWAQIYKEGECNLHIFNAVWATSGDWQPCIRCSVRRFFACLKKNETKLVPWTIGYQAYESQYMSPHQTIVLLLDIWNLVIMDMKSLTFLELKLLDIYVFHDVSPENMLCLTWNEKRGRQRSALLTRWFSGSSSI